jgi:beta-glucuronidase
MKKYALFFLILIITKTLFGQEHLITNVYNRATTSLNGHYIIDPYENGYYNYRYEPFDKQKNPGKGSH